MSSASPTLPVCEQRVLRVTVPCVPSFKSIVESSDRCRRRGVARVVDAEDVERAAVGAELRRDERRLARARLAEDARAVDERLSCRTRSRR